MHVANFVVCIVGKMAQDVLLLFFRNGKGGERWEGRPRGRYRVSKGIRPRMANPIMSNPIMSNKMWDNE